MMREWGSRLRTMAVVAILATGLAACIASPGKFNSTLDLRRDGSFSYSYDGQIYILALSKLAEMGRAMEAGQEFVPTECHDDETFEERECSEEELAEQRAEWDANKEQRAATAAREADSMKAMLGGIDPSDPAAAEELAERLRKQEGWNSVIYKGDGLYEVSFSITSHMGHDFVFPTFERLPMTSYFVTAGRRQDGRVRIEAPGFAAQTSGNPLGSMMGGMAGLAALGAASSAEGEAGEDMPALPQIDGTFRIITDGQILSNNTEEGPVSRPGGQVLEWKITPRTTAAPMALIALAS